LAKGQKEKWNFFSNPTIYWRVQPFFNLNMAIYGFFPPKESFGQVTPRPALFFVAKWQKFPTKQTLAGT
jgi:hypothetical protein